MSEAIPHPVHACPRVTAARSTRGEARLPLSRVRRQLRGLVPLAHRGPLRACRPAVTRPRPPARHGRARVQAPAPSAVRLERELNDRRLASASLLQPAALSPRRLADGGRAGGQGDAHHRHARRERVAAAAAQGRAATVEHDAVRGDIAAVAIPTAVRWPVAHAVHRAASARADALRHVAHALAVAALQVSRRPRAQGSGASRGRPSLALANVVAAVELVDARAAGVTQGLWRAAERDGRAIGRATVHGVRRAAQFSP